ncbi:MAG: iron-containing alcohol dehydrogenase [Planctomycetaceae bacterium]
MTPTRNTWNFFAPDRLLFGSGAVRETGRAAVRLGVKRLLIITDATLVQVGIVNQVRQSLLDAGLAVEVFDGGEPEPAFACAEAAIAAAKAYQPDALIGVGGGSNMDLAKITAGVLTHGGTFQDYFHFDNIPGPVLPLICIPTTAGTGSEVSHAAVLTDHAAGVKVSTLSPYLRPTLAIVDPELTISCPRQATADSGIDALTHAIEAYLATDFHEIEAPASGIPAYEGRHPLGSLFAEEAIRLVGKHLVTAVLDPKNILAREGMALAATLAGLAFSNCGVALVHAMEYPLGGVLHCSHGAGNGLLLPYVMRFNLPYRLSQLSRVAELLGVDISELSEEEAADAAIHKVDEIRATIGVPTRIRELGGVVEQIPDFAAKAYAIKRLMTLTPRPVTLELIEEIYREAM